MSAEQSCLYLGEVMHRRVAPIARRFRYRVCSVLLDVDRVAETARASWLLSYNRFNVFSFHDRDHGACDGSSLRTWTERVLARLDIELAGGQILLLCFPRVLGYGFNPLSLWFCHHADGTLRAVICEVHNTFGERHSYVLHESGAPLDYPVGGVHRKVFHVSPFISMDAQYRFRISRLGSELRVLIHEREHQRPVLVAAQVGQRAAISDATLLRALLRTPLMTLKVMTMIHWQALVLWTRRLPWHRKPSPPTEEIS